MILKLCVCSHRGGIVAEYCRVGETKRCIFGSEIAQTERSVSSNILSINIQIYSLKISSNDYADFFGNIIVHKQFSSLNAKLLFQSELT